MNAYSKDLRLKVLDAVDRGMSERQVADLFAISSETIRRWLKRRWQGGDLSPGRSPGRTPSILSCLQERLALWDQLEANDDATLERHCELWQQRRGVRVSVPTMSRAIRSLGWTFKKRRWWPPNEARRKEEISGSG